MKLRYAVAVLTLAFAANASATTLNGNLTADNEFQIYLSTDDSVIGTLITSGNNWGSTFSFSNAPLISGQDYYLHVVATDWGRPEAFIGEFNLSDNGYTFVNGSQNLLTNVTDWTAQAGSAASWNAPAGTPVDRGVNGVSPWGTKTGISSEAHWIWADEYGQGTAYFSTKLIAAVPEPSSYALLLAGIGLVGFAASRKKHAR